MSNYYRIPSAFHQTKHTVVNSHFVTSIAVADTSSIARQFIADLRKNMSDANHHVYAFRVGFGNSVIEGMSDDGEPTGTAGPPSLAVLRGSDIGDIVLVTSRYFGGTKLGTGGLVRAYTESAQLALENLPTTLKIPKQTLGFDIPYHLYEPVKKLIEQYNADIIEETFAGEVTIVAEFIIDNISNFTVQLQEQTSGQVEPIILES